MTEPRRFTSSELRLYQRCRRQWYLRYFLGYGPRRDPGDVSTSRVGTLVHLGVEQYYLSGNTEDAVEKVATATSINVAELKDVGRDASAKKVASNGELVRIMLEGYFEWLEETGADADLELEAVEEEIEYPLFEGATLLGKVDWKARRRSTGKLVIVDTKSVQGARDQEVLAPLNLQFKHYATISTARGEAVEGVTVRWMRRVKRSVRAAPPFYGEVKVEYPRAVLHSYWDHAEALAREILYTEEILRSGVSPVRAGVGPTVDRTCSSCAFRPACPMLDDETVDETVLLDWSYDKVNPLARYALHDEEEEDE